MTKVFSLCQINHRPDPNGKEEIVKPGVVFELSDKEAGEMLALEAVREPTEAELQLYALANGGKIVEPKPAKESVAEPKAAKVAEPAAGQSTETGTAGEGTESGAAGESNLLG